MLGAAVDIAIGVLLFLGVALLAAFASWCKLESGRLGRQIAELECELRDLNGLLEAAEAARDDAEDQLQIAAEEYAELESIAEAREAFIVDSVRASGAAAAIAEVREFVLGLEAGLANRRDK